MTYITSCSDFDVHSGDITKDSCGLARILCGGDTPAGGMRHSLLAIYDIQSRFKIIAEALLPNRDKPMFFG